MRAGTRFACRAEEHCYDEGMGLGEPSFGKGARIAGIVLLLVLFGLGVSMFSGMDEWLFKPATPEKPTIPLRGPGERAAQMALEITPEPSELGQFTPCDPSIEFQITVTNRTDKPIHITRLVGSCGCVGALMRDREVPPGESRPIEMTIAITRAATHSYSLSLLAGNELVGLARFNYEVVTPVRCTVESVTLSEQTPIAELEFVTTEGERPVKPQRVLTGPGVIRPGASGEPVVAIEMAALDAYADTPAGQEDIGFHRDADGTWNVYRFEVETDHPECPNASVFVRRLR